MDWSRHFRIVHTGGFEHDFRFSDGEGGELGITYPSINFCAAFVNEHSRLSDMYTTVTHEAIHAALRVESAVTEAQEEWVIKRIEHIEEGLFEGME